VTQALEKQSLKPIPGTYKLHQIKTMNTGEIWYRDISCSCEEGELHGGHEWKYCKITKNETKDTFLQGLSHHCNIGLRYLVNEYY
jgi:hypothetical protein